MTEVALIIVETITINGEILEKLLFVDFVLAIVTWNQYIPTSMELLINWPILISFNQCELCKLTNQMYCNFFN